MMWAFLLQCPLAVSFLQLEDDLWFGSLLPCEQDMIRDWVQLTGCQGLSTMLLFALQESNPISLGIE